MLRKRARKNDIDNLFRHAKDLLAMGFFLELISIIFYDNPDKIFSAVVYSDVDIKTRKVSNYEFRSMDLTLTGYDVTQEEIHQFLKERQEHRFGESKSQPTMLWQIGY